MGTHRSGMGTLTEVWDRGFEVWAGDTGLLGMGTVGFGMETWGLGWAHGDSRWI